MATLWRSTYSTPSTYTTDYPLTAEKLRITKEMLSAYSSSLTSKHVTSDKLSPDLCDKTKYVVHYENLRLYLKHGLQLVKVNRILKFGQSCFTVSLQESQ